jgi:FkbM family methyltransferase
MGTGAMTILLRILMKYLNLSFSQCGEDLIIDHILWALKISQPTYFDIGAHHPTRFNNTYRFYLKGSKGVCVEPDPDLFQSLKKKRKRDICLNCGVGRLKISDAEFFVMSSRTLSTFSREEAYRYQGYGNQKILKIIQVPVMPINDILHRNYAGCPNFVSLDVEGMELDVLNSFDFSSYRPEVFCIETVTYAEDNTERKLSEIIDLMTGKGYLLYADTYINSIFVDSGKWNNR